MNEWDLFDAQTPFGMLVNWAEALADLVFVSDNNLLPDDGEPYRLGFAEPEDWWPLVRQLDELVDVEAILALASSLDVRLQLGGLPTELLEAPLDFLASILAGHLPRQPSGRKVSSRTLVQIALDVVYLAQEMPDAAQAAVHAWANLQRAQFRPIDWDLYLATDELLEELEPEDDLPVAVTGFSLLLGLSLMRWPERGGELPMPPMFDDPDAYTELLARWAGLPDDPGVREEGAGEAEALFAQAQLAYMLAQLGEPEDWDFEGEDEEEEAGEADDSLAYSRLSRAIMWIHHRCRHCPERDEVSCQVATIRPERPVPLLDVASEMANTGRIAGCIYT
jgi:hypothetical protein